MRLPFILLLIPLITFGCDIESLFGQNENRIQQVAAIDGLIAFWDFSTVNFDSVWISHYDSAVMDQSFPAYLKRVDDSKKYTISYWPYVDEESKLEIDTSGPFGHAVRFNRGYIFGEVPRTLFEETYLNLHHRSPFTMIAWVKFYGQRHMISGIWDEGGWDKYAGRRQAALFAGLFNQEGVTAHISATGASSYPQSTEDGSQYARERAIDGQAFENGEWVMTGMSYDPDKHQVTAFLNGKLTPLQLEDPVIESVYKSDYTPSANPYEFSYPVFQPKEFVIKYNGYNFEENSVYEHRLFVDLNEKTLMYNRDADESQLSDFEYRITFDMKRNGESIYEKPIIWIAVNGQTVDIPGEYAGFGDMIVTKLEKKIDNRWHQVGTVVERQILEGAPFTFGRALGLGEGEISHGSQLYIDGVAIFNRVLSKNELEEITFTGANQD